MIRKSRYLFVLSTLLWSIQSQPIQSQPVQSQLVNASSFVEQPSGQRNLIVFVHGLGNSGGNNPQIAWSSSTVDRSWPVLMNQETAFKRNFAVFVAQYGTHRFTGNFHIQGLSIELQSILRAKANIADFDRIYFVAHSLGGIVVRNLLIEDKAVRAKTKAIFLFASPMGGSNLASVVRAMRLASVQTAQLGSDPDSPDAVFNTLKDNWYRENIDVPSFCAYETELTDGNLVVPRSSVEPLCTDDVKPLRGAHTPIIYPPNTGMFFAHELLKGWMRSMLPDFEEGAGEQENDGQIVIANCSGNEAYRGPYGKVYARIRELLASQGVHSARYSLPLSQVWVGDKAKAQIFVTNAPADIIIHLSCFQNISADSRISITQRDANFLAFLRSFRDDISNIIVYSRAFDRNGCDFLTRKINDAGLSSAYKDRLKMIPVRDGEMPGDNSSADQTLVFATSSRRSSWAVRPVSQDCFNKSN